MIEMMKLYVIQRERGGRTRERRGRKVRKEERKRE